ncbi:MAG TPA: hypothetical protein VN222_05960 [Novosphingobium sp.]|nr:hypothetical protein [Novosphingobium sp.]
MIRTAVMLGLSSLAPALMLAAAPQSAAAATQLPIRVAGIPADHFARAIKVSDDRLEPYVSFTSKSAHKGQHSLAAGAEGDVHLTAHLDRESGKVSYRVWHDITNRDAPRELNRVHYVAGGKVTQAKLSVARHWESNCVPLETGGQCDQRIRVAFDVPEHVVREIASGYEHGSRKGWAFRYKDAHGSDLDGILAPAEAAGLIQAVDGWKAGAKG